MVDWHLDGRNSTSSFGIKMSLNKKFIKSKLSFSLFQRNKFSVQGSGYKISVLKNLLQ